MIIKRKLIDVKVKNVILSKFGDLTIYFENDIIFHSLINRKEAGNEYFRFIESEKPPVKITREIIQNPTLLKKIIGEEKNFHMYSICDHGVLKFKCNSKE